MNEFAEALRARRTLQGVTLRSLSEIVKLSTGYLSDIELGRRDPPEMNAVERLEAALGVTDGHLSQLAAVVRGQRPSELAKRIQLRPKLRDVVFRLADRSEEEVEEVERYLRRFEENDTKE